MLHLLCVKSTADHYPTCHISAKHTLHQFSIYVGSFLSVSFYSFDMYQFTKVD